MPSKLSAQRTRLRSLQARAAKLVETFLARDALLPGGVYALKRRCGKPTCHCTRGELHETPMLSYRGQGRPQNITPQPGQLPEFEKLTTAYQQVRRARAEWVKLHRQMLSVIDTLQALRVQGGERRFRRLRAGKH